MIRDGGTAMPGGGAGDSDDADSSRGSGGASGSLTVFVHPARAPRNTMPRSVALAMADAGPPTPDLVIHIPAPGPTP